MNIETDPLRNKTEKPKRKLGEEPKVKTVERRRQSMQENPHSLEIMQAFQKAYREVFSSRRQSVLNIEPGLAHYCSCSHLSTLCDKENPVTEDLLMEGRSEETVVNFGQASPQHLPAIEGSSKKAVSVGSTEQRLLVVPSSCHNQKKALACIPPPTFLMVPAMMGISSPPQSPTSSGDTLRRISTNSYGSSLTDNSDSTFEIDSRRSSAWSTLRNAVLEAGHVCKTPIDITIDGTDETPQKKISTISRGKLRRIATQVTRAIRRKRRESMAIRRESRATRVVAAILIAFLICWIPYFCVNVTRGIAMGFSIQINHHLHLKLYVLTSWLGYTHSCFNPVIYMCLNTNFRATMRVWIHRTRKGE
uniref:G_PROTEIN_RECEP_F1_2 domain-containing protein n=1 Tax=Angiostrongylus cantonensis TaxID=6313 RepID=A0A158P7I4_ANGCA